MGGPLLLRCFSDPDTEGRLGGFEGKPVRELSAHHWTKDNPRICAPGPRLTLAPVANH
jgi:hypothetical protein